MYFNSHPHKEDDHESDKNLRIHHISTHILTRRMTLIAAELIIAPVFQLTSSQGGWRCRCWDRYRTDEFQLTSSQGGWHCKSGSQNGKTEFQLTSSQGGWQSMQMLSSWECHFNSHPHKEDDPYPRLWFRSQNHFNSHPHKEDDHIRITLFIQTAFQLTSSQGGWPMACCAWMRCLVISTHILTRRMTISINHNIRLLIFQLTSSQGGWHWLCVCSGKHYDISTHILTRRMTALLFRWYQSEGISTHILTRRMTE